MDNLEDVRQILSICLKAYEADPYIKQLQLNWSDLCALNQIDSKWVKFIPNYCIKMWDEMSIEMKASLLSLALQIETAEEAASDLLSIVQRSIK